MEPNKYAQKVKDMREAQTNFFTAAKKGDKAGKDHWLPISKSLEKEVDAMTAQILPSDQPTTQQSSLF